MTAAVWTLLVLVPLVGGAITPIGGPYTHDMALMDQDKYHVFWKFDETDIWFEVHAKNLGWVGFGLSSDGKMVGGDLTITWVKEGTGISSDRHGIMGNPINVEPAVDASQDWDLLSAVEQGDYTIIQFKRKLMTGDSDDFDITEDADTYFMFSTNPNDPPNENAALQPHTAYGAKEVDLLDDDDDGASTAVVSLLALSLCAALRFLL